jgi:hypothetical protein
MRATDRKKRREGRMEGKGRERGREGKRREGKGREGKGREGKGRTTERERDDGEGLAASVSLFVKIKGLR